MEKKSFLIKGQKTLQGTVEISGYKNSAGAIMAAALLSEKPSKIDNLPRCLDVLNMIEILKEMGVKVEWLNNKQIKISPQNLDPKKIPAHIFEKMRVSVLLIGPLLARFKKFKIPHPGGDKIGLRPISAHLDALKDFGVKVTEKDGFYFFQAPAEKKAGELFLKNFQ